MRAGVACAWAALPPCAAAWAAAAFPPGRPGAAAAVFAAFAATAAALAGAGLSAEAGARRRVAQDLLVAIVATVVVAAATAKMGADLWTGAAVSGGWALAVAATGMLAEIWTGPGGRVLAILILASGSLTTPWWFPRAQTFLPDSVVDANPWLVVCGHAGVDWVRTPGLYPVVGAAYTPAVDAVAAAGRYFLWAAAAGVVVVAVFRLKRRSRGGVRS